MKDRSLYDIIYEDDHLIAVNKPANVLTIPDRFDKEIPSLKSELDKRFGNVFVVHRLDKETSGIVLFAKDENTHRDLNTQFQNQEPERLYHALVEGVFPDEPLEVDIPLMADPSKKGRTIASARGKASLTKFKLAEEFSRTSLVLCKLITGRHHQIRVHLQNIGYPLLVDSFYGNRSNFYVSEFKRNYNVKKGTEETPLISRNTLHAFSISVNHPHTNKEVTFEAPYPKDFKALKQILSKFG